MKKEPRTASEAKTNTQKKAETMSKEKTLLAGLNLESHHAKAFVLFPATWNYILTPIQLGFCYLQHWVQTDNKEQWYT